MNIELQRIYNNNSEITSSVRKTALAGEDAYDLIINAAYSVPTLATDNKLAQCMMYLLKDNSKEFSSYYAEYASSVQAYFNEIIKIYQSLD